MPDPVTLQEIFEAQRDGHLDREVGKPVAHDPDGTPIYRALLGGLYWQKDIVPALRINHRRTRYTAMDGPTKKLVVYMPEATRRCVACLGGGWVDSGDPMRNDRCIPCEGTGDVMLWNFEPELMYLIGGSPEILTFDHEELLERLRTAPRKV